MTLRSCSICRATNCMPASSEILNWVGVAGACEHLDLNWFEYVPGYRTPAGTGTGLSFASWG